MGIRPRIAKQGDVAKARTAIRELYSDVIDNLSNAECDLIIKARIDGLGPIFIVDIITKKRQSHREHLAEREALYNDFRNKVNKK